MRTLCYNCWGYDNRQDSHSDSSHRIDSLVEDSGKYTGGYSAAQKLMGWGGVGCRSCLVGAPVRLRRSGMFFWTAASKLGSEYRQGLAMCSWTDGGMELGEGRVAGDPLWDVSMGRREHSHLRSGGGLANCTVQVRVGAMHRATLFWEEQGVTEETGEESVMFRFEFF